MADEPTIDETHVAGDDLADKAPVAESDGDAFSWKPTRKFIAALIIGVAGVLSSVVVTGDFGEVERGMCATLLTSLAAAYVVPNLPTSGGVPEK